MLVYYFVPFIVSNRYLLFWVSNGHNSVTVQNRTHVYMNFFDHKDPGNHLLQLCPKVVKHPVYIQIFWYTRCLLLQSWYFSLKWRTPCSWKTLIPTWNYTASHDRRLSFGRYEVYIGTSVKAPKNNEAVSFTMWSSGTITGAQTCALGDMSVERLAHQNTIRAVE